MSCGPQIGKTPKTNAYKKLYELQSIILTYFNGHGTLVRDYNKDYSKVITRGTRMSTGMGPW